MENKRGDLSTIFLVIAIILIVVMGALLYMQKIEADRQMAELENNASEMQETINNLQGKIDSISNTINDDNTTVEKNDEEKSIKEVLTPSGFSGSSLIRVVLYSDKTVYVINYDGAGYEEDNITEKTLIAKNADAIEYNVEGKDLKPIIVKGKELEIIETSYNWIEFNSGIKKY